MSLPMTVTARDGKRPALAVGICFEAAHPTGHRSGVTLGGLNDVTPSNNYHFRSSGSPAQQGVPAACAMEYFWQRHSGVEWAGLTSFAPMGRCCPPPVRKAVRHALHRGQVLPAR